MMPTLFIAHGGGPIFWMELPPALRTQVAALGSSLQAVVPTLGRAPKAVVVISAHWEDDVFAVSGHPSPPMLYDYYGFPQHTYEIQYPAPGSPALAAEIQAMIAGAGLPTRLDTERGFDHGVFVPLSQMLPRADVPIVMVSMRCDLDPAAHLALGRALAPLRARDVLIVGSGMTYHNMQGFSPRFAPIADDFDRWLTAATCHIDPAERDALLQRWTEAPHARRVHPREDHLVPLMAIAGAAGADVGRQVFSGPMFGVRVSSYQFGDAA